MNKKDDEILKAISRMEKRQKQKDNGIYALYGELRETKKRKEKRQRNGKRRKQTLRQSTGRKPEETKSNREETRRDEIH